MMTREPAFYREFRCLGGGCPLTCCRDWTIVPDEASLNDYRSAPGGLRERIADSLVTDEEGDRCFRLTEDDLCALLDGDGLCVIQRYWGEEHLCAHCAAYPRFNEEYGCLTENSLAVSCPEAARLTMERGILPLVEMDDGRDDPPFEGVDGELLEGLIRSRETALRLLSGEDAPFWVRMESVLRYADQLQERIDERAYARFSDCTVPLYGDEAFSPKRVKDRAAELLELLSRLDPLRPEWPRLLHRRAGELAELSLDAYAALTAEYAAVRPEWELRLTRLAQALLLRHWPKAVNDDLLLGRAAFAGAACVALHHLALFAWREDRDFSNGDECLLWARFSREVEHDEDNFFTLAELLSHVKYSLGNEYFT